MPSLPPLHLVFSLPRAPSSSNGGTVAPSSAGRCRRSTPPRTNRLDGNLRLGLLSRLVKSRIPERRVLRELISLLHPRLRTPSPFAAVSGHPVVAEHTHASRVSWHIFFVLSSLSIASCIAEAVPISHRCAAVVCTCAPSPSSNQTLKLKLNRTPQVSVPS